MNDATLLTLLRDADRQAGAPPTIDAGLADRVRHRRQRQRVRRLAGATTVATVVITAAVVWTAWPGGPEATRQELAGTPPQPVTIAPQAPGVDEAQIARLRAEIASLRAQAEASTAAVEMLRRINRSRERQETLRPVLQRVDPAIRAACEMELAAVTIVRQADRMLTEHGLVAAAAEAYERAARLFPETRAAAEAGRKLIELKRKHGDLL